MLVKGELLLDLDRFREAGDVYRQVVELARDQDALAAAKIGQARALLRQDDPGTAAALLNELALQYPHPHVIRLYNTAKRRLGQPRIDFTCCFRGRQLAGPATETET